jgi:Kef-type K+ transport system membrane component KefB
MRAIIDICILLFFAKLMGILFQKIGLPENIGFLFTGFLLGPSLFGSINFADFNLIELNDYVIIFARLGSILLLFLVGLNISFVEYRANKINLVALGLLGAVAPLVFGIILYRLIERDLIAILIVSAVLATSSLQLISSSLRTTLSPARLKIATNIIVVDNIIGVLILSIIIAIIEKGPPYSFLSTSSLIVRTLIFSIILLLPTILVIPRLISRMGAWRIYLGGSGGIVEVLVTAMCFFYAALAYEFGLPPITGAIICGIAIGGSRILVRVKDYVEKISFLFAPIFFVIIGASIEVGSLNPINIIIGTILLLIILMLGTISGSLIPDFIVFKNWRASSRIAVSRFSIGSIGLVMAGVGMNTGAITGDIYLQLMILVMATYLIVPKLLDLLKNESS